MTDESPEPPQQPADADGQGDAPESPIDVGSESITLPAVDPALVDYLERDGHHSSREQRNR